MADGPIVVVLGSVNRDLTVHLDRLPRPGETVTGGELTRHHGGKGGNQAVAAARAGAAVRFVGAVGQDDSGDELLDGLVADGVDVSWTRRTPDAATGTALICVDGTGENQIAVAPGANRHVRSVDHALDGAAVALAQLEAPVDEVERFFTSARSVGATTILNVAPFDAEAIRLLPLADVAVVNRDERAALEAGGGELAGTTVVTTLGADGIAAAQADGTEIVVPGIEVDAIDTVGAGDAVCGTVAAALARGASLRDALEEANAAGADATTRRGAR